MNACFICCMIKNKKIKKHKKFCFSVIACYVRLENIYGIAYASSSDPVSPCFNYLYIIIFMSAGQYFDINLFIYIAVTHNNIIEHFI